MDGVPTFAVIIVAGLTVFGLAYVAEEVNIGTSQNTGKMVLAEHSFGKVGDANQDFRSVRLGTFTVGETRGDIDVFSRDKITVHSGLLSHDSVEFSYNATQPTTGKISFEVLGKDGNGKVFVDVNGNRVYEEKLLATSTPTVTIPRQDLHTGVNSIRIGTTSGGWFGSTRYVLEGFDAKVNDRKFHDMTSGFQVYSYELQDFVKSQLSFSITSSVKNQPLEILVNGNKIYSERQVRTQQTVDIDPGEADLHPGLNHVTFRTEGKSRYSVENAELRLRYLGTVDRKKLALEFSPNSTGLNYAGRTDTEEVISFDYQRLMPSAQPMVLTLNNESKKFTPGNGKNTWDLKEGAIEDENRLEIDSNTTYKLNDLKVVSRKVD